MIRTDAVTTKPTLTGQRITLVPLAARHASDVFASLQDTETIRLTGTHTTFTREQIERFCASRAEQDDRIDFAIEDAASGEYAGGVVVNDIDEDNESGGVRIDLTAKYQGRGYGTEAMRMLLRYAFDVIGLHRIRLEVFAFNDRAIRSYVGCGFVHEGREREALTWEGQRHDTLIMGVLSTDVVGA